MMLLLNYHLCCCNSDFLKLQQCHLLFRFVFFGSEVLFFSDVNLLKRSHFFRFRVVSTLVGTAITLPFHSRVLELGHSADV